VHLLGVHIRAVRIVRVERSLLGLNRRLRLQEVVLAVRVLVESRRLGLKYIM
jgi:hypothetical protein